MVPPILAGNQKFRFFFPPPAFLICCQFSNTSPLGSEVQVTPFPTGNNVITSVTSLVSPSPKGKEKVSAQIYPISLPGTLKKKKVIISALANQQGCKREELGFTLGPTMVCPQACIDSTTGTEQREPQETLQWLSRARNHLCCETRGWGTLASDLAQL